MRTVSFRDIPSIVGINVNVVEQKYNAIYMGDFQLKTKGGGWGDQPAAFFWQEKPPIAGYSNYFAILFQGGSLYITSGAVITEGTISAIDCGGADITHSRYRHDFRTAKDGSAIDGGRDYTRIIGANDGSMPKVVQLRAFGPMFEVIDHLERQSEVKGFDLEAELEGAFK